MDDRKLCNKAVLNYDPLGEKPYAKTSFIKAPEHFGKVYQKLLKMCKMFVMRLQEL